MQRKLYDFITREAGIITQDGLLYRRLSTFEADATARKYGYNWAEELVRDLEGAKTVLEEY